MLGVDVSLKPFSMNIGSIVSPAGSDRLRVIPFIAAPFRIGVVSRGITVLGYS